MAKLAWAAWTLCTVACVAPPPYSISSGADVIRGPQPAVTESVAELLATGRETLQDVVPGLRQTAVEVWIQDRPHGGLLDRADTAYSAFTTLRAGRMPRIHVPTQGYRNNLLHELGHALLGPTWAPLPQALEEGLCEILNRDLADPDMLEVRLRCAAEAGGGTTYSASFRVHYPDREPSIVSTFWGHGGGSGGGRSRLDLAQVLALSTLHGLGLEEAELDYIYGAGYLLADRIVQAHGFEGLRALCVRAAGAGLAIVPADWVLVAAGIEGDRTYEQVAREALQAARVQRALASEELVRIFRSAVARAPIERAPIERADPAGGVESFLACTEAVLRIGGEKIALNEVPGFREWALSHWPPD